MTDAPVVYLDHAATTPILGEAMAAMTEQMMLAGNPSSLHGSGRNARRAVEESRERVAAAVNCRPGEVVFTSGATEADNLALKGITWARNSADPQRRRVLTSAVEHHAVLDPAEWLRDQQGYHLDLCGVDAEGRLDLECTAQRIAQEPGTAAMVSVMWANNEVGTIQPVAEVVALAAAHGIPVHTDAVQALGSVPLDFAASGVDAMSITGHKVGGPFGVGALLARRELEVTALVHGGGQERDIRSGTIDAPAIVGFACAVELAVKRQVEHAERLATLRDRLIAGVQEVVPDAHLHGDPVNRLPGNAHIGFPGCEGDSMLMLLDARGIECSTGSACSAGVPQASHVLVAMGRNEIDARHSLRFSLGHTTTEADVEALLEAIGPVVERARASRR